MLSVSGPMSVRIPSQKWKVGLLHLLFWVDSRVKTVMLSDASRVSIGCVLMQGGNIIA